MLLEPDESIKQNEVNNSSVVLRIEAADRSLLILGDLGVEGGDRLLATNPSELIKADYVQMAHHGQNGVGKNVYEAIDPDYCLWPTPDWLWENNAGRGYDTHIWKTIVTRGWMSELGIKWHYIMKDGTQENTVRRRKGVNFSKLSNQRNNNNTDKNKSGCKYTSIGGQALIEGIMMRGPKKSAMAVRNPAGEIVLESWENETSKRPNYTYIY